MDERQFIGALICLGAVALIAFFVGYKSVTDQPELTIPECPACNCPHVTCAKVDCVAEVNKMLDDSETLERRFEQ